MVFMPNHCTDYWWWWWCFDSWRRTWATFYRSNHCMPAGQARNVANKQIGIFFFYMWKPPPAFTPPGFAESNRLKPRGVPLCAWEGRDPGTAFSRHPEANEYLPDSNCPPSTQKAKYGLFKTHFIYYYS